MSATAEIEQAVYVVEDDAPARRLICALAQSLRIPCLTFATAEAFLKHYQPQMSGCLVLDMVMPDLNGLALQQELTWRGAIIPIIFITGYGDVPSAVEAMRHGAFNFLQKPLNNTTLSDNIERALDLDRRNRMNLAGINSIRQRLHSLTPREREVLDEVSRGQPNKVIAMNLHISERSVELHRSKAMEKMGAGSVAQLMRMLLVLEEGPGSASHH
jgi:two-component system, LuxR family, response regulator FixJ